MTRSKQIRFKPTSPRPKKDNICVRLKIERIYNKVPPVKSLKTTQYAIHDTARPVRLRGKKLGRPRREIRAFILTANLGGDQLASSGGPGALGPSAFRA